MIREEHTSSLASLMWKHRKTNSVGHISTSGTNKLLCLLIFFKPLSSFFLSMSPSTWTPFIFRTPGWFKVDPTRNQKSVKQGLICCILRAGWMDVCFRLQNASNGQSWFYFLFAITAKFQFFDSLIFLAIRAGCSTDHCRIEAQGSLFIGVSVISLLPPNPPLSHVHTYSYINTH